MRAISAVQALRIPGTSLTQSLEMQFQLERAVLEMPEVKTYFSRVGTAEVATDPMPPNISDGYIMLKDREQWPDPNKPKVAVGRRADRAARTIARQRVRDQSAHSAAFQRADLGREIGPGHQDLRRRSAAADEGRQCNRRRA